MYGRDPPRLLNYDFGTTITFEVDNYLWERDGVLEELKEQLAKTQQLMKARADHKRRDVEYEVDDLVY